MSGIDCETKGAFPVNSNFLFYYKNVGAIADDEEEWENFIKILGIGLPTTFRITPCSNMSMLVGRQFQRLFCDKNCDLNDCLLSSATEALPLPSQIPWYPGGLAWQFDCPRKSLSTVEFTRHFKHFLKIEQEAGNISCQEAVSMVPPLLLDVESHHFVLDACASPGSKTCQLIEMLQSDCHSPKGLVCANEPDTARCYLLTHQIHRNPKPFTMVTKYKAQNFPNIKLSKDTMLLFDRVLCDVPCSGDGTIRKKSNAGLSWNFYRALKLHRTQISILKRCVELTAVGGRLVYSTCSLNPIENEAVVAEILRITSREKLVLLDMSHKLPSLKRKCGLSTWKVINSKNEVYECYEDVLKKTKKKLSKSMFPPRDGEEFNLERCWRIYPHQQNTGGFFIAVFEVLGSVVFDEEKQDEKEEKFVEDPFRPLLRHMSDSITENLKSYYGVKMDDAMMKEMLECLLFRSRNVDQEQTSLDGVKMIYATSPAVYKAITEAQDPIKLVAAGIRILEYNKKFQNSELGFWRITSDGLSLLAEYIEKRKIQICYNDFLLLIEKKSLLDRELSIHEQFKVIRENLGCGPLIASYEGSHVSQGENYENESFTTTHHLMCWLGESSLSLSISGTEYDSLFNFYISKDHTYKLKIDILKSAN